MTETWEGSPKRSTITKTPPVKLDLACEAQAPLGTPSPEDRRTSVSCYSRVPMTHRVCLLPRAAEYVAGLAIPKRNPS